MKAITVEPHQPETARLEDIPEPDVTGGSVLVEAIAVGVCGTDVEIVEGKYGWAPPGRTRLVLGHESLGRVVDPGPGGTFREGDLVADHAPRTTGRLRQGAPPPGGRHQGRHPVLGGLIGNEPARPDGFHDNFMNHGLPLVPPFRAASCIGLQHPEASCPYLDCSAVWSYRWR